MNGRPTIDSFRVFQYGARGAVALLLLTGLLLRSDFARAQSQTGQHLTGALFGLGSSSQRLLYRWEMDRDDASGRWRSQYRTPTGEIAVEDEVTWMRGQFVRYSYVRRTINETSSVERRDG